jgi:hypothetical protein
MAACFENVAFVSALRELAIQAEQIRATPTLVTQAQPKGNNTGNNSAIDTASLFFDSESRAIQAQSADEEAQERSNQLGLSVRLAAEINRLRTTNLPENAGSSSAPKPSLPPEVPPRLFALPDRQQLVPNALQPNARSDLEVLMRYSNEAIAAAMGVPASVM